MIYRDIVNAINFTDCIFQFFSTVRTVNICKFCFTLNKFGIFVRFIMVMVTATAFFAVIVVMIVTATTFFTVFVVVTATAFFTMFVVMIVTATAFFTMFVVMIVTTTTFFAVFMVMIVTATTFFTVFVMVIVTARTAFTVFVVVMVTATAFFAVIVVMIVAATAFFAVFVVMFVMMFFCLPRFVITAQNSVRLNLVDNSLYLAYHLVIFCIITVKYKFFSHKIDGNIAETVNFCNVPFKICGTVCTVNACDR